VRRSAVAISRHLKMTARRNSLGTILPCRLVIRAVRGPFATCHERPFQFLRPTRFFYPVRRFSYQSEAVRTRPCRPPKARAVQYMQTRLAEANPHGLETKMSLKIGPRRTYSMAPLTPRGRLYDQSQPRHQTADLLCNAFVKERLVCREGRVKIIQYHADHRGRDCGTHYAPFN
jgi:hypothetical protein